MRAWASPNPRIRRDRLLVQTRGGLALTGGLVAATAVLTSFSDETDALALGLSDLLDSTGTWLLWTVAAGLPVLVGIVLGVLVRPFTRLLSPGTTQQR